MGAQEDMSVTDDTGEAAAVEAEVTHLGLRFVRLLGVSFGKCGCDQTAAA